MRPLHIIIQNVIIDNQYKFNVLITACVVNIIILIFLLYFIISTNNLFLAEKIAI